MRAVLLSRLYFEKTPHLVERMREGVATEAMEDARRAAHRLRGMLATLGAHAAAAVAEALEAGLAKGVTSGADGLLESLTGELGKLERALSELESSARSLPPAVTV